MTSKRQNPPNARFWFWENNGWVKLTLKPNQQIVWQDGWTTDEGWSSKQLVFTHLGDAIERESSSDGVDCDGRLSSICLCVCKMENLKADEPYRDADEWVPPGVPQWEKQTSSQRDYNAEAAGY